ncbi:MAG: transposase [Gemmatimonadaceae bacterium]
MVYDEHFGPTYGAWRAVVCEVADKFLACGILDHGFARVRCTTCVHEYLLALSCKGRYFCPSGDGEFAKRLARDCAQNPVALERLTDDGPGPPVYDRSDKRDGPPAGTEPVDPLEFLARFVTHIPNQHQLMTRYYGWYANRSRGARRQTAAAPIAIAAHEALPLREARRRWAEPPHAPAGTPGPSALPSDHTGIQIPIPDLNRCQDCHDERREERNGVRVHFVESIVGNWL